MTWQTCVASKGKDATAFGNGSGWDDFPESWRLIKGFGEFEFEFDGRFFVENLVKKLGRNFHLFLAFQYWFFEIFNRLSFFALHPFFSLLSLEISPISINHTFSLDFLTSLGTNDLPYVTFMKNDRNAFRSEKQKIPSVNENKNKIHKWKLSDVNKSALLMLK